MNELILVNVDTKTLVYQKGVDGIRELIMQGENI